MSIHWTKLILKLGKKIDMSNANMKIERNLVINDLVRVSTNANDKQCPFWSQCWYAFIGQNPYLNLGERLIKEMHVKFDK